MIPLEFTFVLFLKTSRFTCRRKIADKGTGAFSMGYTPPPPLIFFLFCYFWLEDSMKV